MSELEYGKCQICGKEAPMQRTYFRYPIKCECHSPEHFELVIHCKDCIPKEPEYTKVSLKTAELSRAAGWIKVEDALPAEDEEVYMFDGQNVAIGSYTENPYPSGRVKEWSTRDIVMNFNARNVSRWCRRILPKEE